MNQITILFIFLLFLLSPKVFATELIVGYPEFPPYTFTDQKQAKGLGIDLINKLAKNLKLTIKLKAIETYGNGKTRLKLGRIDALLLASKNAERDNIAVFSTPYLNNNWSWFARLGTKYDYDSSQSKRHLKIATYKGANTHQWLKDNHYNIIYPTTDIQAMIRQLFTQRVDAIFLSEQVFLQALNNSKWSKNELEKHQYIQQPFGIYVSKKFLEGRPTFMKELNAQIRKIKQLTPIVL